MVVMRYIGLIDGNDGAYGMVFPDLPGCTAMGETIDDAVRAASEAIGDWIGTVLAKGGEIPAARSLEELRREPDVIEALAEGASLSAINVVRSSGKPVRANLSLDGGVVSAIDAEAARRGITRSAMVEVMAREQLPNMAF